MAGTRDELDHILAIQLTVAWAGDALSEPQRLGWWPTDRLVAALAPLPDSYPMPFAQKGR